MFNLFYLGVYCFFALFLLVQDVLHHLHYHRHKRRNNDPDDEHAEILLHERNIPKEIAGENEEADPKNASCNVVEQKDRILHFPDARHKRRKCPHDGNEAR